MKDITVRIKRYPVSDEAPLPSLFSKGHPRSIYPYNHRKSQSEQRSEKVDMRVLRLANEFLEVDILPDVGGHVWGVKDLVTGREMFHRTDALKHQDLAIAGPWIATGIEFNFPVTHSILTLATVNSTTGTEPDGSAWVRVGATDKLFGLQWQMTLRLRPGVRALEIDGWLHNPTDLEHPYCYWGNAGATTHESLRLYYPFKYSEHHGGKLFKWPWDDGCDLSYWKNLKQPISAFGDSGDKRYFGAYYEKFKFGLVHTADPKTLPGKKYFAWGNGKAGERWGKLLSEKLPDYVELQSGTRNDQEFWSTLEPHSTIAFHERWQAIDNVGGISDANELLTVFVGQEKGKAVVRAQSTEPLRGVRFRAYVDRPTDPPQSPLEQRGEEEIASWVADLRPDKAFEKKLDYAGPVKLDVDPCRETEFRLSTCDAALIDYGPPPKTREEIRDPAEVSAANYRDAAKNNMQVFNWADAWINYEAALKLAPGDITLQEEVGHFRVRRMEYAEAKPLLLDVLAKTASPQRPLLWGLLRIAWATGDDALENSILAKLNDPLAKVLGRLKHRDAAGAAQSANGATLERLVRERDLGAAVLVARRLSGAPDAKLLAALKNAYPLDPLVCFEAGDGSVDALLKVDVDAAITLADIYLMYGDAASALKAVTAAAKVRGAWQLSDIVLANHCAKLAGENSPAPRDCEKFDPLAERPWQDCFYTIVPQALAAAPKDARLHYILGNLLQHYGRTEEALAAWRASADNGGDWPALHFALALVNSAPGRCTDADIEKLSQTARQLDNPMTDEHFYRVLRQTGRRARLLKEYEDRLAQPGHYAGLTISYALELVANSRYDEAIEYMLSRKHEATHGGGRLTRAHIRCRVARARKFIKEKRLADARRELEICFVIQHNFNEDAQVLHCLAEVYCVLGQIETAEGNPAKARDWYTKAANEDHDLHSYLRLWQAIGMIHSGRREEGERTLARIETMSDAALKLKGDEHSHFHYLKSILHRHRGDEEAAEREYARAIQTGLMGFTW